LSENGFDVWVGNSRGNKFSWFHKSLNPDVDREYWDFDFDEMGKFDNPSVIEYILKKEDK